MDDKLWLKTGKWPERVRESLDYPEAPLFKILDDAAEKYSENTYTIFRGRGNSFREVRESADKIANFLVNQGIQKGDRVAVFLPNVPHYPPIFFGILKAGAVVVTCNPRYTTGELNFQLKDSGAKLVFGLDHETFGPTTYEAVKGTDVKKVVICSLKTFLPKVTAILGGLLGKIPKSPYYEDDITLFYDDIIKQYEATTPDVQVDPKNDLGLILYTGGTTGTPKGAMLTHYNLFSNVLQMDEWIKLDPPKEMVHGEEVYIGALPWYHSYGLTLTMITSVYQACSVICIPDPTAGDPPMTELLEEISKNKGTILHCVPALYAGMINHPKVGEYDLTSLKGCGSGAAPLPPELARAFESVTGATLFEGYGLTETSPITHANPSQVARRKFGSIGLPVSDTDAIIVDIDSRNVALPQGETGIIAINGPQVFKGYWHKEEETAATFTTINGKKYFLTGDVGHMDEEGYFHISDRLKDMIIVGGLKAYPREIEDIFFEHPKIKMAAVIGLPLENGTGGEYVKAFVVLKDGETATPEELIEWSTEKMASYKKPREIDIVDSLPLTAVGKVLRRELKEAEMAKRE
ncbi:MAG: long-chain fatty acid--CoA ligase [Candidatus Thorarchaeota archaeon]|nr:MAG: long-chain fatty acid--CoA ligase [Candidatus Thorarchaeota archaeon]